MTNFVLIPGAGGTAWYWHRVAPLLGEAVAVDLPGDDPDAGLPEYADRIVEAAGGREVVLVAQSLGAFSALHAAARLDLRALVLVNAMVPVPGETPGEWWEASGWSAQRTGDFDLERDFLHDVPRDVAQAGLPYQRPEADIVFGQRCEFTWPDVPTTVLAGADDRFFGLEFQRALARERLGLEAQAVPGGHLVALSRPEELAEAIRCHSLPRSPVTQV